MLMVLVEPGLLSLRDLKTHGSRIEARCAELLEIGDDAALEAIRLMQDRYKKLSLDNQHRVHIGDAGLAHLGFSLVRGNRSTVYVATFPDRIDVFSPDYRNRRLISGSHHLDDLP